MEFGFVPSHVVSDLQDIGNWKSRASAIDNLHKALRDVGDKSQLLPSLPKFMAFLMQLVADPNFKIAISSIQILSDLVNIAGPDIEPHLRSIIPNLLEKFTDSKALVRNANFKVLRNLVAASQPRQLVDLLGVGMTHSNWRVREEVVNTLIMVMLLPCNRDGLNYGSIFKLLSLAVGDPKDHVKAVGLEGMAVLARCTGRSEVMSLLAQGGVGLGSEACAQVHARLANAALPSLGPDGVVQHIMEPCPDTLDSISADLPASRRTGLVPLHPQPHQPHQPSLQPFSQQAGKLPWEAPPIPRPRLRPDNVLVKSSGLDGVGPGGGSPGTNGGAQVSPSSSCASPAGVPPPPVWLSSSTTTPGGGNLDGSPPNYAPLAVGAHRTGGAAREGGAADGLLMPASNALSKSSFGRYASSNLKAVTLGGAGVLPPPPQPQAQQQQGSLPPRRGSHSPPERDGAGALGASHGGSGADAGGLAELGSLQDGRALHSLPLGVLDGAPSLGRTAGGGALRDGLPAGAPHGLALSASLTTNPLLLSSPLAHAPHPPAAGSKDSSADAGGGVSGPWGRPRRSLRSPPSNLQPSAAAIASTGSHDSGLGRRAGVLGSLGSGGGRGGLSGLSSSSQSVVSAARGELDQSMVSMRDMVVLQGGGEEAARQQQQQQQLPLEQPQGEALQGGSLSLSGSNVSLSGLAALKQSRQATASRALDQGHKDPGLDGLAHARQKKDNLSLLKAELNRRGSPALPLPSRAHKPSLDLTPQEGSEPPQLPPQQEHQHQQQQQQQQAPGSFRHGRDSSPGPCQSPIPPPIPEDRTFRTSSSNSTGPAPMGAGGAADAAGYLDMLRGSCNGSSAWVGGAVGRGGAPALGAGEQQPAAAAAGGLGGRDGEQLQAQPQQPPLRRQLSPSAPLRPTLYSGQQAGTLAGAQQQQQQQQGGLRPLWLHGPMEDDAAHRPETFSPNKVELLANLKRRQIEKRAPSSQLPSRKASGDGEGLELVLHPSSKSSSAMVHPMPHGVATFNGGAAYHHHPGPLSAQGSGLDAPLQEGGAHAHASPWGTFGAPGSGGGLGLGLGRGGRGGGMGLLGGRKVAPLPAHPQGQQQQQSHHLLPPWISPQLDSEGALVGQWGGAGPQGVDAPALPQGPGSASDCSDSSSISAQAEPAGGSVSGGKGGRALGPVAAGIEALKGRVGRGLGLGSRGRAGAQPQQPQGAGGDGSGSGNGDGAQEPEVLTAQHLGLQRISTQCGISTGLTTAGSAPPAPHAQAALGPAGSAPGVVVGSSAAAAGGSNCASPMFAARTRLAPAMFERLRLRSADLPTPSSGGPGGAAGTPTHYTQPPTPASVAEGTGYSPLGSAKSLASNAGGNFWEKSMKPMEELSAADLTPLPEPERSLRAAITKMVQANNADRKELDWQGQHDAINDSRRIVAHHPEVLRPCLHEFVRAAVPALDQLRSVTVKNAITLMQEMFVALGRQLDREVDDIAPMLLKKAGEVSNAGRENFLAAEADRALSEMCRHVSEHRALAVLSASANHKSMHVRAKVGSHLDSMMELPSMRTLLATNQQCLERLFKVAAGFLNEGGLETRTYGKRILFNIKACQGSKAELDRLISMVQPAMLAKKVSDTMDSLTSLPPVPCTAAARGAAGLNLPRVPLSRQASIGSGSGPSFTASAFPPSPAYGSSGGIVSSASGGILSGHALQEAAGAQAHNHFGRGKQSISAPIGGAGGDGVVPPAKRGLRGPGSSGTSNSARSRAAAAAQAGLAADAEGSLPAPLRAGQSKPLPVEDSDVQEALSKILAGFGARDFRERIEVLKSLESIACEQQGLAATPEAQLVDLLDGMTARISEGNAKVAIQALETLGALFHCLRGRCSAGLNTLVPALAATLGSSNDKIRGVGIKATDALVASVDPALLIQNFAHCASHSSLRGRPLLVERLLVLARALWPTRPTLVTKHALPAAFSLLNDAKGDGRTAANVLLTGLAQLMGPQLLEHTAGLQPALQQRVSDAVAVAGSKLGS